MKRRDLVLVIDRFEGDKVVIESGEGNLLISKKKLPKDAKEGDVLKIIIDKDSSKKRKQSIEELSEELFE